MPDPSLVRLIPDCRVSVDGKKLDIGKDAALTRVDVDLDLDLFGQCVLTFNDPKLVLINGKDFASGTAVKVELGFHTKLQEVFEGEVVALEPIFRRDTPPLLKVVCQESLHRLALSPMTRAFNQVDDKQIATKIAQEHGLTAQAPSGTKEHILQGNVTDAVFLRRLAAKSGNTLRIEGKKLIIGPPPKGQNIDIVPGDGLRKIKVKIKANTQVGEVTVHGWDPKTKKEITAKAKPQGSTQDGAKKYGNNASLAIAGHSLMPADTASAEAMAKGRLRKIAEGFIEAQGDMIGNPEVVPGAVLNLDKLGAEIDGSYRVHHAAHAFDKHGYFVRFDAVRIGKKKPAKSRPPGSGAAQNPPRFEDVHLIFLEVKSIGGTALPNQTVRILDAATGEQVGELVTTDDKGMLRAEVPDPKKKYRVEILDHEIRHALVFEPEEKAAVLVCHFLDQGGAPIAQEKVEASGSSGKIELETDENGRIEFAARLESHQLKIRGETFHAHALPLADKDKEENFYRFLLGDPSDVHMLVAELKTIGGTPLVNHAVRILDPETGEEVRHAHSDEHGVVRVEVPENKTYKVEIADEDEEHPVEAFEPEEKGAVLLCHFVDAGGAPIANEKVEAKAGDLRLELTTDEGGRVESNAGLAPYQLTVRGQTFTAHALPVTDQAKEENLYHFVVGDPADVHLLVTEVKAIGGTPLVSHAVRVFDPETGEEVGHTHTDEAGVLRLEVPENKKYRVEIVDEESEPVALRFEPDEKQAVLICHFVDVAGEPIAGERVEASTGSDELELQTDARGRIEASARLAAYQLKIRGRAFTAHAIPGADRDKDENLYRFIVESE